MRLVLMGPPGAGKGTQGERLARELDVPRYATGDILRDARRRDTELGREAAGYMDAGELVPDDVILGIVREALDRAEAADGFVFDGFPRTVDQAGGLEAILEERGESLDVVLYLEVPEEELVRRLSSRRVCEGCGAVARVPDEDDAAACEACGGELVQREDDRPATIRNRLRVYRRQTEPVLDRYRASEVRVETVDGTGSVDEEEVLLRRGFERVVLGLSGGVDSSVTALLCARALAPENVTGFLLPSRVSSDESRDQALEVAEIAGIETRTVDITGAVEGYLDRHEPDASGLRRGNVMARVRMVVLFDQAKKLSALPVGTGNKSERLLGYFTWHADDAPPINPIGDLFKTQVWDLARHLGVPAEIVDKPATAELIEEQTDEGELGVAYPEADLVLHHLLHGRSPEELVDQGFSEEKVEIVWGRLQSTHFKRHLPTVAMISSTAVGEWYLRPVDY